VRKSKIPGADGRRVGTHGISGAVCKARTSVRMLPK
jgi:hypothetical protein